MSCCSSRISSIATRLSDCYNAGMDETHEIIELVGGKHDGEQCSMLRGFQAIRIPVMSDEPDIRYVRRSEFDDKFDLVDPDQQSG